MLCMVGSMLVHVWCMIGSSINECLYWLSMVGACVV